MMELFLHLVLYNMKYEMALERNKCFLEENRIESIPFIIILMLISVSYFSKVRFLFVLLVESCVFFIYSTC